MSLKSKSFVVTFVSEFSSHQLKGLINRALSFEIDEAVDKDMFRHKNGRKSYPKCDYDIIEMGGEKC